MRTADDCVPSDEFNDICLVRAGIRDRSAAPDYGGRRLSLAREMYNYCISDRMSSSWLAPAPRALHSRTKLKTHFAASSRGPSLHRMEANCLFAVLSRGLGGEDYYQFPSWVHSKGSVNNKIMALTSFTVSKGNQILLARKRKNTCCHQDQHMMAPNAELPVCKLRFPFQPVENNGHKYDNNAPLMDTVVSSWTLCWCDTLWFHCDAPL